MSNDLNKLIQLAPLDYQEKIVNGLCLKDYVEIVNDNFHKYEENCKQYSITKTEFFVYALMTGCFYSEIQTPLVRGSKPNKFIKKCHKLYDSLLAKIPKTKHEIVYRNEKYIPLFSYEEAYKSKKSILYKHYLTSSKDDFKGKVQLVITPLPYEKTKAHNVYLIYNHGEASETTPEYQINFERNTSFIVDKIEGKEGNKYVHCHEI